MQRAFRQVIVLLAFVTTVGAAHSLAAQASSSVNAGQAAKQPAAVSGELTQVNTDAKTLAIKASNGSEMQFRYTDATEVTGSEKGAAGLATMKGAQVTVYFNADAAVATATRIDIHAKS